MHKDSMTCLLHQTAWQTTCLTCIQSESQDLTVVQPLVTSQHVTQPRCIKQVWESNAFCKHYPSCGTDIFSTSFCNVLLDDTKTKPNETCSISAAASALFLKYLSKFLKRRQYSWRFYSCDDWRSLNGIIFLKNCSAKNSCISSYWTRSEAVKKARHDVIGHWAHAEANCWI